VKAAYFLIPLGLLSLVQGVLAFSGCGSTTETPDGGPACEPACIDAFGDVPLADGIAGFDAEASPSCDAACAKQIGFSECPYLGCIAECQRLYGACLTPTYETAYRSLLSCEATATYSCRASDSGLLPTPTDCTTATTAVAKACVAGEGGLMDAGPCSSMPSASLCDQCCVGMFSEGHDTYEVALTSCACDSPGTCATPCAASQCTGAAPAPGDACSLCLAKAVGSGGACAHIVSQGCQMDPNCIAYEGCLTSNDCASIK
jgi:hypothetical protein